MGVENKSSQFKIAIFGLIVLLILAIIFAGWFLISRSKSLPLSSMMTRIPFVGARLVKSSSNEQSLVEQLEKEKSLLDAEWQKLNRQASEINKKQKELEKKEWELNEREAKLNQEKARVEQTLDDIKNIAQYYELMAPNKAATIMETLEDEVVIRIFKNMKKEAVAEILANMDPKKAAALTKKLSGEQ
ncbi:Flagellar motility protein MotE, a chaperone for MotC folding [Caldanaerovirga acetigignens]|uniref:Flagellar motility protein MotE, a chaperone for MotC folding n=1 Tax=Caldanaerovirga acetigignens TaxID=447595 RepID=A0A1M7G2V6_9FIRM|nr:hypothetical protein [Caldanaerovirga acetigignens]SHM10601.1 Flagellar motility protein MotE, a chaperone for MotC folding [Caldanaerovirga acetigignens]